MKHPYWDRTATNEKVMENATIDAKLMVDVHQCAVMTSGRRCYVTTWAKDILESNETSKCLRNDPYEIVAEHALGRAMGAPERQTIEGSLSVDPLRKTLGKERPTETVDVDMAVLEAFAAAVKESQDPMKTWRTVATVRDQDQSARLRKIKEEFSTGGAEPDDFHRSSPFKSAAHTVRDLEESVSPNVSLGLAAAGRFEGVGGWTVASGP